MKPGQQMRVLSSAPVPRETTNPYLTMVRDSLRRTPDVQLIDFSWRAAILGRFDIFHAHWPEILVGGRRGAKKWARQCLFAILLLKLSVRRIAIVRTVHNVELPQGISAVERMLLGRLERATAAYIRLNDRTQIPADRAACTILHGHYREWFSAQPRSDRCAGRFGYAGLIRRYKGVDQMVRAFGSLDDPELSLRIGGQPSSEELAAVVRSAADQDPRVVTDLHFLTDAELVRIITESELVVLPYRFMHNSGGALAALSLDRPVLVPDTQVNRDLAAEVGPGWVQLFDGDLSGWAMLEALSGVRQARRLTSDSRPDLSARGWERVGERHRALYRVALRAMRAGAQQDE